MKIWNTLSMSNFDDPDNKPLDKKKIIDQYTFFKENNAYVVINGKEYKYWWQGKFGLAEDVRFDKVLDITNKKDQEEYYKYLKTDKLIDLVLPDNASGGISVKEMSLQYYNSIIEHRHQNVFIEKKGINHYLHPFHTIQPQEVERFYVCDTLAFLRNNKIYDWFDAKNLALTRYYEYITREFHDASFAIDRNSIVGTQGPKVNDVPSTYVCFGNPHDVYFANLTIVSKMYLDKIVLMRRHLKFSELGNSISRLDHVFTGEVERIELDLNNPNPDVLKTMEELGICRKD